MWIRITAVDVSAQTQKAMTAMILTTHRFLSALLLDEDFLRHVFLSNMAATLCAKLLPKQGNVELTLDEIDFIAASGSYVELSRPF